MADDAEQLPPDPAQAALQIEPAEALLAAIGVRPIISHAIEKITDGQWHDVANAQDICDTMAKEMCAGTLASYTYVDFDRIDYDQTLRDLSTAYEPQQVEQMLSHIPLSVPGLAGSFMALADKTFQYLYSQFPIMLRESVAGNNNIKPSRSLLNRFEALLWVLDHPLGMFNLTQDATLTQGQLDGLTTVYPSIVNYVREVSIPDAVEEARTSKPGFQFTRATEQGVRKLLGRVPLPPELQQIMQQLPQIQRPQSQSAQPNATGSLSTETAPRTDQIEQRSP
jgi:hypothetical protein